MHGSMPRKLPRQARSQALVEAILDATAHILIRSGRDAANTNAIAVEAGVSIGSLYQYFPNRDAILSALVHRHGHRIHALVTEAMQPPPETLDEAIRRVVHAVFAAHRIDPGLHDALDHDFAHGPGAHHHPTTKQAVAEQMGLLPEAVRAEIRCVDAAHAPLVVAEIAHSLAHAALVHPSEPRDEAAIERQAVSAVLAYLRAG